MNVELMASLMNPAPVALEHYLSKRLRNTATLWSTRKQPAKPIGPPESFMAI